MMSLSKKLDKDKFQNYLRNYAIKVASRREHSSFEIEQKLKSKTIYYNNKFTYHAENNDIGFIDPNKISQEQTDIIKQIIASLIETDIINNDRFISSYEKKLRSKGRSSFYILNSMLSKGINWKGQAYSNLVPTTNPELQAAIRFLNRRKFAYKNDQKKALLALKRQGFSYQIAKQALDQSHD